MSYGSQVPVPDGLVETYAAKHKARFDEWPTDFLVMVKIYCGGVIPARVKRLADQLRQTRFWTPKPSRIPAGYTRISLGPHSFLVLTSEVLPAREDRS